MALQNEHGNGLAAFILMLGFVIICLFSTGLTLGWGGFILILRGEGAFAHLCKEDLLTCQAADIRLNLVYTLSYTISLATTLPSGAIADRFPPRIIVPSALFVCTSGFVLIAFAGYFEPWSWNLLFPGFALLALSSQLPQLAAFQYTQLMPKGGSLMTGCLSGAYGVSSLVPVLLHLFWKGSGGRGNLQMIATSYAALLATLLLFALNLPFGRAQASGALCRYKWNRGFFIENLNTSDNFTSAPHSSLWSHVFSKDFMVFCIFFVTRVHFCGLYLGIVNLHLQDIDEAKADSLTSIFSWIAPFGVAVGPISAWWVTSRSRGPNRGAIETGSICVALQLLQMAIASSEVSGLQVIVFVCYTLGQETFFAAMFAWIGSRFGFEHFGTLVGILLLLAGLISLSINPIAAAAASAQEGFRWTFLWLAVVCLLSLLVLFLLVYGPVVQAGDSARHVTLDKPDHDCPISDTTEALPESCYKPEPKSSSEAPNTIKKLDCMPDREADMARSSIDLSPSAVVASLSEAQAKISL